MQRSSTVKQRLQKKSSEKIMLYSGTNHTQVSLIWGCFWRSGAGLPIFVREIDQERPLIRTTLACVPLAALSLQLAIDHHFCISHSHCQFARPYSSQSSLSTINMAGPVAESASPICIANLPNQRHKIVAKRGAAFTIMVGHYHTRCAYRG